MPNSANSCPIIGIGGWAPDFGEERAAKAKKWLLSALKNGYRHIDPAYSYGTEKAVGEAIIESGIPREDIFVFSKLPSHHGRVLELIQESLDNLGFKWLDMYLMHWPFSAPYELEGLKLNILKHDIAVVAYNPSGTDIVRKDPVIVELAAKYNATPTQIILAWHLSRNVVVIPKGTNEERQKENHNLPTLEEEDLKKINALDRGQRICNKGDENGLVYGMSIEDLGW
ncbi:Aldo-keto reductase [Mycena sanguinolenta]|uniref:Aldo-keto reductase n=1 Tax=Mycena sanguinolenta TaxID=230812 RepID=A0A8H7DGI7_9AGAR|nr:Aldo-keto reductase [Mycena sanguinolenta]